MKQIKVKTIESPNSLDMFFYQVIYPTGESFQYKTTIAGWAILSSVFTEAGYSIEYI